MNPLAPIVQSRLDSLQAESADQLQDLQPRAGVTKNAPNIVLALALRAWVDYCSVSLLPSVWRHCRHGSQIRPIF